MCLAVCFLVQICKDKYGNCGTASFLAGGSKVSPYPLPSTPILFMFDVFVAVSVQTEFTKTEADSVLRNISLTGTFCRQSRTACMVKSGRVTLATTRDPG